MTDTNSVAKDRQPGAWSSSWAKWGLILLAGGLGIAIAHFVMGSPSANPAGTTPLAGPLAVDRLWNATRGNLSTIFLLAGALVLAADRLSLRRRSEQHWQEYELARQKTFREERFRTIISASADAYIKISEDGVIREWNQQAKDLFGWTALEAVGRQLVDVIMRGEDREAAAERIRGYWQLEDRNGGTRITDKAVNRAGRTLYLEVTVWVDEEEGAQMNFFIRDQTQSHEVEQAIQKALADEREAVLRLQEVDRVKTDFVSSISHELRSPLTSTLGYLELLSDGDVGELQPKQAHMVEIASRNAKRLKTLIEDLLTLSRIEAGSFRVQFRPVNLHESLRKAIQEHTVTASTRNVALTLDADENADVVAGDGAELTRALSNIVANAVKFTPPGGSVGVSVIRSYERVSVVITDNGIGIPAEEQAELFERFYRASAAIQQQHQGAGLGLTIAKTIFEHHGGTITLKSDTSTGTTVTIELPVLPFEADAIKEPSVAAVPAATVVL